MEFSRQEYWSRLPFQGIFPTQGLNLGLLHCRQIVYSLRYQGSQNDVISLLSLKAKSYVEDEGLEKPVFSDGVLRTEGRGLLDSHHTPWEGGWSQAQAHRPKTQEPTPVFLPPLGYKGRETEA